MSVAVSYLHGNIIVFNKMAGEERFCCRAEGSLVLGGAQSTDMGFLRFLPLYRLSVSLRDHSRDLSKSVEKIWGVYVR